MYFALRVKVLGGLGDALYDSFLLLHVLAAIVGFSERVAKQRRRRRPSGASARAQSPSPMPTSEPRASHKLKDAIRCSGVTLVVKSGGAWQLTDPSIVLSLALYSLATACSPPAPGE